MKAHDQLKPNVIVATDENAHQRRLRASEGTMLLRLNEICEILHLLIVTPMSQILGCQ